MMTPRVREGAKAASTSSGVYMVQRMRQNDKRWFYFLAVITSIQLMLPAAAFIRYGEKTWYPPWMFFFSYLLAFAATAVIAARWDRVRSTPAWPLLVLETLLMVRLAIQSAHEGVGAYGLLMYASTGLIFAALWLLAPEPEWLVIFAYAGVFLATLSSVWLLVDPTTALYAGTKSIGTEAVEKANTLEGPFANPNTLGAALGLPFPFVFYLKNSAFRYSAAALILAPLVLTNSRTTLLAVIAAFLLLAFVTYGGPSKKLATTVSAAAMLIAAAVTVLVPLLFNHNPRFFSGRGRLWADALNAWASSKAIGIGFSWHPSGLGSPHNVAMQMLARGGLVWFAAVAAVIVIVILVSRLCAEAGDYVPATYMVALFLASAAEGTVSILVGDPWFGLTGFTIATLLTSWQAVKSNRAAKTAKFSAAAPRF